MATVAHLDAEVFSALARIHRADDLDADEVAALLGRLGELAVAGYRSRRTVERRVGAAGTTSPPAMARTSRPHRRCRPAWSLPTIGLRERYPTWPIDLDGDLS